MNTLLYSKDRVGELLWNITAPSLIYSADLLGTIADDIVAIDQAMKWGFGWQQGPFEMWDSIGVEKSVAKMKEEGRDVPEWVENMLANGVNSFYKEEEANVCFYHNGEYKQVQENPKVINLKRMKKQKGVIKKNSGASLIDLGDGVALLEFTSPNNAIGPDITQMINYAIDEVAKNYKGLVIGTKVKTSVLGQILR